MSVNLELHFLLSHFYVDGQNYTKAKKRAVLTLNQTKILGTYRDQNGAFKYAGFVNEGTYSDGSSLTVIELFCQPVKRSAGIDDVFNQQNMFVLEVKFHILGQPDGAGGGIAVVIAGNPDEIYLVGNCDRSG